MADDVEKRFDRPASFQAAAKFVALFVVIAGVAFAVYAFVARESVVAASTVPLILLVGGIGAFVRTYREWKVAGGWVAWQGAGWFLLVAMLLALSIPGSVILSGAVR